jgi:uncharacterized protein (DUF1330 family)
MKTIDPDRDRLPEIFAGIPQSTPIVMLNLLRFRAQASYPAGSDHPPCSGREAYARYSAVALKKVNEVGGAPIWIGTAHGSVIAPPEETWDEVVLVRYPSLGAFVQMIMQPDYLDAVVHRSSALEDSRLVATVEHALP